MTGDARTAAPPEQAGPPAPRALRVDLFTWLRGDILVKADKITMASSLELRVPFLDTEVFEVARKVDSDLKITRETSKFALRQALDGADEVVAVARLVGDQLEQDQPQLARSKHAASPAARATPATTAAEAAVASVIAVPELAYAANWINFSTFRIVEVYAVVTPIYLVTGYTILFLLRLLERRYAIRR